MAEHLPLTLHRRRACLLRSASVAAVILSLATTPAQAQLARIRGDAPALPAGGGAAPGGVAVPGGDVRSASMRDALAAQQATQKQAADMRQYVTATRQAASTAAFRATPTDGISVNGLYPIAAIREAMAKVQAGDAAGSAQLLISARAANDASGAATWEGAQLPTANAANTAVEIVQTQSRAVLSWDRFDIGANTTLTFKQQQNGVAQADWIAVNRVVNSVDPTTILGKLNADGQVYILNGAGVIFGKGSQVNLRSLVASSLDLGNSATRISATSLRLNTLQDRNSVFLNNGPFPSQRNDGPGGGTPLFLSPRIEPRPGTLREDGTVPTGTDAPPQFLPRNEGDVVVDAGATITASPGGAIILAGPKVENSGILSATNGQVSMVGGRLITYQQMTGEAGNDDPAVRGLYLRAVTFDGSNRAITEPDAPLDDARDLGTVINRGLIESKRGYLSLVTGELGSVLNEGQLAATTSVSRNGKIALYGGTITLGGSSDANAAGSITILPDDNESTLPDGSKAVETIPQGSDAEPASFKRSEIEFGVVRTPSVNRQGAPIGPNDPVAFGARTATNVILGENALIYAPNALITNNANALAGDATSPRGASVSLAAGARIDVSGLKDVAADVSRNFITIKPVKRNELRDTPNYREIAIGDEFTLNGTTLTVDIRRTGVRADGVRWIGSPLIEAGSIASQIPITAAELMTRGGDVAFALDPTIAAPDAGRFTLGAGASIDISGGWVRYDPSNVSTSKLVTSDGRIVDIGDADPNDDFVSVFGGFTGTQPRFGVVSEFVNPIAAGARTEAGYDEGRDAGSLRVAAAAVDVAGTLSGRAFAGSLQVATALRPTGTRTVAAGDPRKLQASALQMPSGGYVNLNPTLGSDIIVYTGARGPVAPGLAQSLLDATMLNAAGLSALTLNTNGAVTFAGSDVAALNLYLTPGQIAAGVTASDLLTPGGPSRLSLAPGATLTVRAGRTIRVDGSIVVPSGTIDLATTNTFANAIPVANAAGNAYRPDDNILDVYAPGSAIPSLLDIRVTGTLSTAGLWVNDYLGGEASLGLGRAWRDGGSINLTVAPSIFAYIGASAQTATKAADLSGSIDILAGASIDVTAGGYVRADQLIDFSGRGGSVSLVNATDYVGNLTLRNDERIGGTSRPADGLYGDNQTVGFTPVGRDGEYVDRLVPGLVPDERRAHVAIADGTLAAFGFRGSGTFRLVSPDIAFGSAASSSNSTAIGLDFLARTGFGGLDLTSNRALVVADLFANGRQANSAFTQVTSFAVRSGETLDLTQTLFPLITGRDDISTLLGFATGGSIRSLAALTPSVPTDQAAIDRRAASLTIGGYGELLVDAGGLVTGAPGAAIRATKIVNSGTISLPGGSITQVDTTAFARNIPFLAPFVGVRSLGEILGGPLANGQYSEQALNVAGITNPRTGALATNADLFTLTAGNALGQNGARSERNVIILGTGDLGVGIDLRAGSLTDLSGTVVLNDRARFIVDPATGTQQQIRQGVLYDGGSITIGSTLLTDSTIEQPREALFRAAPGAKIDISGARATLDTFVPSLGYVGRDEWSNAGRITALGGGSLSGALVNAYGGYRDDGGLFARSGTIDAALATPDALGGTLEWRRPTVRGIDPGTASPALYADAITRGGFDTLIARGGILFDGTVDLSLGKALIVTSNLTASGRLESFRVQPVSATSGTVASIAAPYIRFESDAALLDVQLAALPPLPTTPAELSFTSGAAGIDFVGTTYFDRTIGTLSFATPGDVRLTGVNRGLQASDVFTGSNGQFVSFADTLFDAGRVYATTGTGNLQAFLEAEAKGVATATNVRPFLLLAANNRRLTFGNSFVNRATPLSAGSYLRVEAGEIVQNGHLAAPIGRLEIGTLSPVTIGALSRDVTSSVTFGAGSLTTVSGGATPVPYGTTLDLKEYVFSPFGQTPLSVAPVGQLSLGGSAIDISDGATVSLKGGGDLFAYEFVSGVGGSRDVLSRTSTDAFSSNAYDSATGIGFQYADKRQVFAIIPVSDAKGIAPFDPVYSADYGSAGPVDLYGVNAGRSVFLDGSTGVPAGEYLLLPAHYALLDGKNGIRAYRLVENSGTAAPAAGQPQTLRDGSVIVSGSYGYAETGFRDSALRSFTIQSADTFSKSSRIEVNSGAAIVKAAAERAQKPIPRLPVDSARLVLSALTELKIAGFFDTASAGGKGAQVDITGDRIEVAAASAVPAGVGTLTLVDSELGKLNADSLFIGGSRAAGANGATDLRIDANELTVRSGATLSAPEVLLAVGNQLPDGSVGTSTLTVETGATIRATGVLADPTAADFVVRSGAASRGGDSSGAGSVLRVANGPERLIARVGEAAAENTLAGAALVIGAATFSGDNLAIDTSRNFGADEDAKLDARHIALSSDTLIFNGSAKASVVRSALLTTLLAADRLTLRSPNAIQFGDAARAYPQNEGGYAFNDLVIDAPTIQLVQPPFPTFTTHVDFKARDFRWSNSSAASPSCIAFTCGRANSSFSVTASGEISFGGGTMRTLYAGGDVTFTAAKGIYYEGAGRFDAGNAALSLNTPILADRSAIADPRLQPSRPDFTFAANGNITIAGPSGATPASLTDLAGNRAPGARLGFATSDARTKVAGRVQDILVRDTLIEASAGSIDLRSQRNLTIDGAVTIATPGFTKTFGDALDSVMVAAPGGAVRLIAKGGDLLFRQGSDAAGAITRATLITDSGPAADGAGDRMKGAAGSLSLIAAGRIDTIDAAGTVVAGFGPTLNSGVTGTRAGSFTFDSNVSAFDLPAWLAAYGAPFGEAVSIRSGSGDLSVAAGQLLRSASVGLTADGGRVTVAGTIDTSGIDVHALDAKGNPLFTLAEAAKARVAGGNIELFGQDGVSLAATALLDTHSSGYAEADARAARAGDVTIGIGQGAGAAISVAQGARIDVSATRTEANVRAGFARDTGRFVGETAKDPVLLTDRTVYRFVEADTGGTVTLRAPLLGAGMDRVDIRLSDPAAIIGADEVQVAAYARYDLDSLKGTPGISAGADGGVILDPSAGYDLTTPFEGNLLSSDFVTAAGLASIPHFIRNFSVAAADGRTSFAGYRLRPDVELVSSGSISLNSTWNLAAASIDQQAAYQAGLLDLIAPLSRPGAPVYSLKTGREADLLEGFGSYRGADFLYRVGGRATGEAPLIRFRARGDVTIARSISDGFFTFRDRSDAAFINYQLGGGDRTYNPALAIVCGTLGNGNTCSDVIPFDPAVPPVERNNVSVRVTIANVIAGTQSSAPAIHSPLSARANDAAATGTALDTVTGRPAGAPLEFAELFPTLDGGRMRSSDISIAAGGDTDLSANVRHVDLSTDAVARVVDGTPGTNGQPSRPEYRVVSTRGKAGIAGTDLQLEFGTALSGLEDYSLGGLVDATEPGGYNIDQLDRDSFAILNWGVASQGGQSFALANCALAGPKCATGFFDGRPIVGLKASPTGVVAPLGQILDFLEQTKADYLARVADGRIRATPPPPIPQIGFGGGVVPVQTVVRTGAGNISIDAAGDVDLRDGANTIWRNPNGSKGFNVGLETAQVGGTAVYTAGERVANSDLTGRYADGQIGTVTLASARFDPTEENVNLAPTPQAVSGFAVPLARRGGDVALRAGGDVLGRLDQWSASYRTGNSTDLRVGQADVSPIEFKAGNIGGGTALWRVGTGREFASAAQYFTAGIGTLAGGDIDIVAGRSVSDLTVAANSATSQLSVDGSLAPVLVTFGRGDVAIRTGDDLIGGQFDISSGQARFDIGRNVTLTPAQTFNNSAGKELPRRTALFRMENATVALRSGGTVDSIAAIYLGSGNSGADIDRSLFSRVSGIDAVSVGSLSIDGGRLLAPSLELASLAGSVAIRGAAGTATSLFPSSIGQLSILSSGSLGDFAVAMLDLDPTDPNANLALSANGFPGIDPTVDELKRRLLHNSNITHLGDFQPARIFTDGSISNVSINLAKQGSLIAGKDIIDAYIVGQNIHATDQTRIVAGRDITSTTNALTDPNLPSRLPFFGGSSIIVGGAGSVTVSAGRDLGPFATSAVIVNRQGASELLPLTYGGGIYTVGNEYNPWLAPKGADLSILFGVAPGIDYAGLREAYLNPANFARLDGDLFVQVADAQGNLRPDRTRAVYAPILAAWLRDNAPEQFAAVFGGQTFSDTAALTAASYGRAQALYDAFASLDAKQQQPFLIKRLYFNELEQAAQPDSPSFQQYIRGYRAIEALFPTALGYTDNLAAYTTDPATISADHPLGVPRRTLVDGQPLVADRVSTGNADLRFAAIQTARGGDLTILGPGGDFLVGSITRSSEQPARRATRLGTALPFGNLRPDNRSIRAIPSGYEGILTLRGGDVRYFSDGDLRLNQSRLFTNATGDISAWSSNGDLNAGQGAKSASNFPPITVRFGLNGLPVVDTAGGIVGAGIGAFKQSPSDPNSQIILTAPVGEVDAGDAGVRATGDVFVAAARVANADNFSAGGSLSGVPTTTVAAAPAVPASAGSALAAIVKSTQPPVSGDTRSLISVEIVGFAGGSKCDDPDNKDESCPR